MDLFDSALSVSSEDLQLWLRGQGEVAWGDFFLNPRRLRGSDFLMRWSQGVWSEERVVDAVGATERYWALPYGPSGVAPSDDITAFELYFERLERAGFGALKRPDLLVFRRADQALISGLVANLGGPQELPFMPEDNPPMRQVLRAALLAVECENSLWVAKRMPGYGSELKPMRRLGGRPGLRKGTVVPTVILKDEDRSPLEEWQRKRGVGVHLWHVFYDMAFGLALDRAEELIGEGLVEPTVQVFQAPGGATTRKVIYKTPYHYAYRLGESQEEPALVPDCIMDKNGHVLPYVKFEGGSLALHAEALEVLARAESGRAG